MIGKCKYIIVLIACLSCLPLFSTGPSSISVRIIPIARNTAGQILCKTSYTCTTGAQMPMPIYSHLCVVSVEGIIEIKEFANFDPDYSNYDDMFDELNSFSRQLDELTLSSENDVLEYFREKYDFTIPIEIKENEYEEIILEQSDYENAQVVSTGNHSSSNLPSPKIQVYYRYENIYYIDGILILKNRE